jgi:hypothetical protein
MKSKIPTLVLSYEGEESLRYRQTLICRSQTNAFYSGLAVFLGGLFVKITEFFTSLLQMVRPDAQVVTETKSPSMKQSDLCVPVQEDIWMT